MDTTKTTIKKLREENRAFRKTLKEIMDFIDSGQKYSFYPIVEKIERHKIYSKRGW